MQVKATIIKFFQHFLSHPKVDVNDIYTLAPHLFNRRNAYPLNLIHDTCLRKFAVIECILIFFGSRLLTSMTVIISTTVQIYIFLLIVPDFWQNYNLFSEFFLIIYQKALFFKCMVYNQMSNHSKMNELNELTIYLDKKRGIKFDT